MKSKIVKILTDLHNKSGGHSGYYLRTLQKELGLKQEDLSSELNELHKEGKIISCIGIHGKMTKLKV